MIKNKLSTVLLCFASTSVLVSAGSSYDYMGRAPQQGGNQQQQQQGIYYPQDNTRETATFPPAWKEDRFMLNLDKGVAKEVANKMTAYRKTMTMTYDMDMLMKPITKPFRAIDRIYITSEYITTIVFPDRYAIKSVVSSAPLIENRFSSNVVTIKPKRDFVEGNLVVSMTTGDKNTVMTIRLDRYIPGMERDAKNYEAKYAKDKQFVSMMIVYQDKPNYELDEILEAYFKLYGESAVEMFDEDCKFDTMSYKGIPFYIIRDDKFGTIEYNDINFRIANEYVGCGEEEGMNIHDNDGILK